MGADGGCLGIFALICHFSPQPTNQNLAISLEHPFLEWLVCYCQKLFTILSSPLILDIEISYIDFPPWTFFQPRVLFSLHNDEKSEIDPPIYFQTKFRELLSNFATDGSKDGDRSGSACVTPYGACKCRLPDNASIFSAEIKAIDLAMDHIEQSRNTDFIIFFRFSLCSSITT